MISIERNRMIKTNNFEENICYICSEKFKFRYSLKWYLRERNEQKKELFAIDNRADFVKNMQEFKGLEYYIKEQTKYHMDILEAICKTPLLLNVYYTNTITTKKTNLGQGDISIITLYPRASETLTFKLGLDNEFIYSFNILNTESKNPNILVNLKMMTILNVSKLEYLEKE